MCITLWLDQRGPFLFYPQIHGQLGTYRKLSFLKSLTGYILSLQGENETEIVVSVRSDTTPETEERYTLNLVAITTLSDVISPSGAAVFDQQGRTSSITIRASNNPYGVVQFQRSSLFARSQDGSTVHFTIIREFGTFGECGSCFLIFPFVRVHCLV